MSDIGTKIRFSRIEAGLSQGELAKRAGISRSAVFRYEAGERTPNLDTVRAIAEALNVSEAELLFERTEADLRNQREEKEAEYLELFRDPTWMRIVSIFRKLDQDEQAEAVEMLEYFIVRNRRTNPNRER